MGGHLSIDLTVVVLNQPYGNPGSLGEPLGMWSGVAPVGGDATGGFTRVTFVPQNPTTTPLLEDQRRQYVWFVDGASHHEGPGDPIFVSVEVFTHWARPNAALAMPALYQKVIDESATISQFRPRENLIPPPVQRLPLFWDTQELAGTNNQLVVLAVNTNVNNNEAEYSVYGRYYDRQILANRGFSRLVSPPAISQFA